MTEKNYTEADIAEAVEIVSRAFMEELKQVLDPLTLIEVATRVVRNLESQVI